MIKNCFNYVGSKDRILEQLYENIDSSKKILVDMFCGSGVVGLNMSDKFDFVVLNDGCWQVIEILKYFKQHTPNEVLVEIEKWIDRFKLSKDNKEGYLEARALYNEKINRGVFDPILLFTLIMQSFNYNIVFNKIEEYNVPSGIGRSYFNSNIKDKLLRFVEKINNVNNIEFTTTRMTTSNVNDIVENIQDKNAFSETFIYADPPYFCSDASHSRIYGLKWTEDEERALYNYLDKVVECGGSFLLSNLVENNGTINTILIEWMQKYNVVEVDQNYKNCCYQKKREDYTNREVLVRSF